MFGAAQPDCEILVEPLGIDAETVLSQGSAQHLHATGAADPQAHFFGSLISTRE
jgi:hypothetical protein